MTVASVYYNVSKNTVYAKTGPTHVGQELMNFVSLWDSVVVNQNLSNFNCIFDASEIDVEGYNPNVSDSSEDPAKDFYGIEAFSVRKRGNGKFILIVDGESASSIFLDFYKPDAVVTSMEDAEHYLKHGDGVNRGPSSFQE